MASKGYIAKQEREQRERHHAEDLQEEEKKSKRQFASNIISSVLGGAGRIIAAKTKNDAAWYKQLIKDAENFVKIPTYDNVVVPNQNKSAYRVPATGDLQYAEYDRGPGVVLALEYVNSLGVERDASGTYHYGINEGMVSTLSQLAKVNSRSVSADPDVAGLYMLSATEVASRLAWYKTNIEICGHFNSEQAFVRDALLKARGISNPNTFVQELAQHRKIYQILASRFNIEVPLPMDLSYVKRKVWVNSIVLRDCSINKGQYITFKPFRFGDIDFDTTTFVWNKLIPQSANAFQLYIEDLLNKLALDVDFQTFAGNLRAAVPANKLAVLPLEVGEYMTVIQAEDEVLMQIHNIKTLPAGLRSGFISNLPDFEQFQTVKTTGDVLTMDPILAVPATYLTSNPYAKLSADLAFVHTKFQSASILDFYKDTINADDMLVATRLHAQYFINLYNTSGVEVTSTFMLHDHFSLTMESCGTEIIVCGVSYSYSYYMDEYNNAISTVTSMLSEVQICTYMGYDMWDSSIPQLYVSLFMTLGERSNYDWIFPTYVGSSDGEDYSGWHINVFCEFGNKFTINDDDLGRIHTYCNKSLFYINTDQFISIK